MYRNREYLAFVRTQPCCVCHTVKEVMHAHHFGRHGTAIKADDTYTVPLCGGHHGDLHSSKTGGVYPYTKKELEQRFAGAMAACLAAWVKQLDGGIGGEIEVGRPMSLDGEALTVLELDDCGGGLCRVNWRGSEMLIPEGLLRVYTSAAQRANQDPERYEVVHQVPPETDGGAGHWAEAGRAELSPSGWLECVLAINLPAGARVALVPHRDLVARGVPL